MPTSTKQNQPFQIELPWRTIIRLLLAAIVVWCWLKLTALFLLALIAIIFAVTLDPVVRMFEARGVARWAASGLVVFMLMGTIGGGAYLASSQFSAQAATVGAQVLKSERDLVSRIPSAWVGRISAQDANEKIQRYLRDAGIRAAQGMARALLLVMLGAVLTLYLLIEAKIMYAWVLAFVPSANRQKVSQTAEECQRVIFGYLAGNLATSIFATIFVFATLKITGVPAALLLAILAGVCDFVPVLGFALSGIPAVFLALTVSPALAVVVALLYVLYHAIENYVIAPYVYGDRLRLSNVAVVVAFAVGAELAGIVGALIALPIAAAYPAIERIWLRDTIGQAVREHQAIEQGDIDSLAAVPISKSA